jgi:HEXXH motif-containing protein
MRAIRPRARRGVETARDVRVRGTLAAVTALPTAMLTLPAPGERTVERLLEGVAHHALRTLLTRPAHDLPPTLARALPRVQGALARSSRQAPTRLREAVLSADVLAPTLALASGAHPAAECLSRAIPALLASLGTLPEPVRWDVAVTGIVDEVRARALHFEPGARALRIGPEGLVIETRDGALRLDASDDVARALPGTRVVHPFTRIHEALPALQLSLCDTNPLAMFEAHPEKQGNAIDLGGRAAREWAGALHDALELVRLALPAWWAELPRTLTRIVPVGWHDERHFSASYREAPRVAYLSLHPDPLTLAEAIVHETQHGKLNLLSWSDAVLDNGYTEWTSSPVRPDLRPIMGVLLAVHAFVPVAALHHGLAQRHHPLTESAMFARRRAEVLAGNARGLAILREKAAPTTRGARILADLERLHAVLAEAGAALSDLRTDTALPG